MKHRKISRLLNSQSLIIKPQDSPPSLQLSLKFSLIRDSTTTWTLTGLRQWRLLLYCTNNLRSPASSKITRECFSLTIK